MIPVPDFNVHRISASGSVWSLISSLVLGRAEVILKDRLHHKTNIVTNISMGEIHRTVLLLDLYKLLVATWRPSQLLLFTVCVTRTTRPGSPYLRSYHHVLVIAVVSSESGIRTSPVRRRPTRCAPPPRTPVLLRQEAVLRDSSLDRSRSPSPRGAPPAPSPQPLRL
jgi:hypothetical protein